MFSLNKCVCLRRRVRECEGERRVRICLFILFMLRGKNNGSNRRTQVLVSERAKERERERLYKRQNYNCILIYVDVCMYVSMCVNV